MEKLLSGLQKFLLERIETPLFGGILVSADLKRVFLVKSGEQWDFIWAKLLGLGSSLDSVVHTVFRMYNLIEHSSGIIC